MVYYFIMAKFFTGKPSPPEHLIDRKSEIKEILSKIKNKTIDYNIALLGYRRIGKTSILLKIKEMLLKEKNYVVVYFDVKENMGEPKLFLSRLEKTIFNAYIEKLSLTQKTVAKKDQINKIFTIIRTKLISKKIKSIGVDISIEGVISPKFELGDKSPSYSSLFLSVLQTPSAFAEKNKLKFVIILDEFQELIELKNYSGLKDIFGLFRAIIQNRAENVSFIISGSRVNMLNNILGSGTSSLFVHFERLAIEDMDEKNSIKLFREYLKGKKIKVDDTNAKEAYDLVGGQPLYLMALAEKWDGSTDLNDVLHHILTDTMGTLKLYADYVLLEDTKSVPKGPLVRTILRVLSYTDIGYSYSEISKKIGVQMTNLPKYVKPLVEADLLSKTKSGFIIRDKTIRKYLQLEAADLEA